MNESLFNVQIIILNSTT